MSDCVDLTLDSEEEPPPQPAGTKRRTPSPEEDSDEVVIVDGAQEKRPRLQPGPQEAADNDGDDVVLLGEVGTTALRDFPHARPDCGNHPFRQQVAAGNATRCAQCYCFVCDVNAGQCKYWGTGARNRDHANAHSSHYWLTLRKLARSSNAAEVLQAEFSSSSPTLTTDAAVAAAAKRSSAPQAARGGMLSPVTLWARKAAADSAHNASAAAAAAAGGGGVKAEASKQAAKASKPKHQQPVRPPASPWLRPMPDPTSLSTPIQLLATLELPFKTVKGVTVDEVAQRLAPHGFYKERSRGFVQWGEHLGIENIANTHFCVTKRKEVPDTLELLPLSAPEGLADAAPSTARPWVITVVSHEPGVKPVVVGVEVNAGAKVSKLREAVEGALKAHHGYDAASEGLIFALAQGAVPTSLRWLKNLEERLSDEQLSPERSYSCYAFRAPAAVVNDYHKPPAPAPGHGWETPTPKLMVLLHEKHEELEDGAGGGAGGGGGADSDSDSGGAPSIQQLLSEELGERPRPKVVSVGAPQLLLLDGTHYLAGGAGADASVRQVMVKHLVRYALEGQPEPTSQQSAWKFKLHRCSASLHYAHNHEYSNPSSGRLTANYDSPAALLFVDWGRGRSPLTARAPPGFDAAAFEARPQLSDAALQAKIAELPALLKAAQRHATATKMLKGLPREVIAELVAATARSPPPVGTNPAAFAAVEYKPSAAAVLSVLKAPGTTPAAAAPAKGSKGSKGAKTAAAAAAAAAAAGAEEAAPGSSAAGAIAAAAGAYAKHKKAAPMERLGVLRVQVYIWPTPGRLHKSICEDASDWSSISTSRHGRVRSSTCELTRVMNARLLQMPGGYALLKELHDLRHTDQPGRGITALMEWAEAAERAPARQPPGLTVELHPYQKQTLAFMQEAEAWPGGWRHLLWRWLPHPQQQQQLGSGGGDAAAAAAAAGQGGGGPGTNKKQKVGASGAAAAAGGRSDAADDASEGGEGGEGGAVSARGVWWSPVLGRVSASVPPAPWGGFLAEEMGLGKTVEVLGLVLSNPPPASLVAGSIDRETRKVVSRGTLVVCAVSLVGQWCAEASKKLGGSLKVYPYHGQNRIRDKKRLATEFDIVATTYATLASDFQGKKSASNPLGDVEWWRVVFDEGHTVKNQNAAHSKACVAIEADRRWCCTGTPINNDITDLLGQFAALHMQPLATKSFFDAHVKNAFATHGYGCSLVPLLYTLRKTLIRHTKAQSIAGQAVLALPAKTEQLVPVVLSPAEREGYLRVHREAAALWQSVRRLAPAAVNQRLLQIMSLLLPLRRICSGGVLSPTDLALPQHLLDDLPTGHTAAAAAAAGSTAAAAAAAAGLHAPLAAARAMGSMLSVAEDTSIEVPELECPICLDAYECPVMTLCHHWYCKECILGVLSSNPHCPLCRRLVDTAGLRAPGKKSPEPAPASKPSRGAAKKKGGSSSKQTQKQKAAAAAAAKKRKRRSRSSDTEESETDTDTLDDEDEDDSSSEAGEEESGGGDAAAGGSGEGGARAGSAGSSLVCESKLQALVAELRAMRTTDPSSKALVFSQYNSTLEWLKRRLPEEGFGFRTITGSMPLKQRSKAIEAFQGDPPTTVFLLSIRAGAVGINLTAANHVFLLEPCINPALEEQAIGRAWRMGQTREVVVKRFYVKGSIEERIMDVRATRQGPGAAGATAAAVAAASPPAGRGRKKMAAAELAGNVQADRQVLKIAELDVLFRTPELDDGTGAAAPAAAPAAAAPAAGAANPGAAPAAGADAPAAGADAPAAADEAPAPAAPAAADEAPQPMDTDPSTGAAAAAEAPAAAEADIAAGGVDAAAAAANPWGIPAQQLDAMMQLQQQQMAFYQQQQQLQQLAASNSLMMSQLGFDASAMAALNSGAMLAHGVFAGPQFPQWGLPGGMDPAMAAALGPPPGLAYAPAMAAGLPGAPSDPAAAAAAGEQQPPRAPGDEQQEQEE